jgi:hypothetical protein
MQARTVKALLRASVALMSVAGLLVFAGSALGNAANPLPNTAKVDSVSLANGQYTITVQGQWNWVTQTDCPTARDGVGYNVAWFDPSDTANPIGGNNSPNGVIDVGSATDNIVHSVYTDGGPSNTLVTSSNPFYDGVPSSYLTHNTTSTKPTNTDASNWVSNCNNEDPTTKISSGQWGPIAHTYPAGDNGPFVFCPIMYDPHGSGTAAGGKIGSSGTGDLTAGGNGHNNDNSYEGNGQGANGNNCQKLTIPTISTSAQPSANLGSPISDQATLNGSSPTGTITWNVYSSSDRSCSTPLNAQPSTLTTSVTSGNGTYTSPSFTPTSPGSYQWVATYSGDSSNASVSTNCNDPNEVSLINSFQPSISTSATSSVVVGQSIQDVATLSGGSNPTGTITWKLYGPGDSSCATAIQTYSANVTGNGNYTSPSFATTNTGVYRWIASYSGDAANGAVSGKCNDNGENSNVLPATPAIATSATSSVVVGQSIQDVATLSGGDNPTGTITWKLYGPGDSSCSSAIQTYTASASGDGNYTSPSFATTHTGVYRWIASYGGDNNNTPVSGKCNDNGENSDVTPETPAIVTAVTPSTAVVGDVIKDTATLSGGDSPTGKITWSLYSNAGCTDLVDTISVPVNGDGTYTASPGFTTSTAGVYFWVAKYSGDANNGAVSTSCGDANEETPVSSPGIQVQKLESAPCADLADVTEPPGITPCSGQWSSYTHGIIIVKIPHEGNYSIPIDYQIRVTNTGSTPLALSLNDPLCDAGTIAGPTVVTGTLTGTTLSAGGSAYYTCTHTLTQNDGNTSASGQPFTNTATVTGTPPSGPPVHGTDIVTVDRKPLPPPQPKHFCTNVKTGKKVPWPHFPKHKPKACKPLKPRNPHGFTG